ncbi:MAG: UTP--glucose-1-phosphate uridylyltransferase [Alphaproteobacteria bacterium]|nr:UTP--glucose-1-phosphate uridylyltransferase [Alphaproteobacteria bacterium]
MSRKPEVCILPVAGLSTRNLPATKALHKGFLTLHSKPIIQYAVDACAEIGIKEIVFIYSDQSCKHLFETHFSPYPWLENHLREKNKLDLLKVVQEIIPAGMKFSFAEQSEPKGNGHAVLMAREIVGDRDFVVMWPDDVYVNIRKGKGILAQLLDVYEQEGGMVENIMEFPREQMVRYGALIGAVRDGRIVHAKGKIEKPALEDVPSNYASMGPYILPNEIMDILPEVRKGTNGEINLADAMGLAAERGMKLTGVLCDALRFDCGTNKDLEKSNLKLTLMEDPDMRAYCKELLDTMLV